MLFNISKYKLKKSIIYHDDRKIMRHPWKLRIQTHCYVQRTFTYPNGTSGFLGVKH